MTAIQQEIIAIMKEGQPLLKFGRVCYVGSKKFNANSVKSLIKKGLIEFKDRNDNEFDCYELSTPSLLTTDKK